jgi:hypothetical protein
MDKYRILIENIRDGSLVELYSVISRLIKDNAMDTRADEMYQLSLINTRKDIVSELESRGWQQNWLKT